MIVGSGRDNVSNIIEGLYGHISVARNPDRIFLRVKAFFLAAASRLENSFLVMAV